MKKLVSLITQALSLLIVGGFSLSISEQSGRIASLNLWAESDTARVASYQDANLLINRTPAMMATMPASWKR
ncbi:hypothetical protein [Endozoicomonas atrinae]|uniref:hypothetical protein n=1 Tax=Endozoicomonas atrinae TaxID=1333660 RepID=UPI0008246ABD|nr:hypothetical protein [Endozoicomonas atrinae]